MIEVVFIGEVGVGVELFTDAEVAQRFADRMSDNGFEVSVTSIVSNI